MESIIVYSLWGLTSEMILFSYSHFTGEETDEIGVKWPHSLGSCQAGWDVSEEKEWGWSNSEVSALTTHTVLRDLIQHSTHQLLKLVILKLY